MPLSALQALARGFAFIAFICPLLNRDDLLTCVDQMDGDQDGALTASELDAFYAAHSSCLNSAFLNTITGAQTITLCDTNADGNLTLTDWTDPAGCFQKRSRQDVLCRACEKCGLLNVVKKRLAE
jgi:hypothetical protein